MADKIKDPKDMSLEELRRLKEQLEVEHLQLTVGTIKAESDRRRRGVEAQQRSLEDANKQIIAEQRVCRHKTGGKDLVGILAGDGSKGGYSILQHTYPNGDTGAHCTRCAKALFQPGCRMQRACDPAAYQAQAKSEAEYKRQMAEWKEWMERSSWNTPSGTQTHLITEGRQRKQRASA